MLGPIYSGEMTGTLDWGVEISVSGIRVALVVRF